MKKKDDGVITDQELLEKQKKARSTVIINAALIGFMFGIIVYSVLHHTLGLCTLIPLFIIYKLVNNSRRTKELDRILKERNLKQK